MQHITDMKNLSTAMLGCQLRPCTSGRTANKVIHKSTSDPKSLTLHAEISPSLLLGFGMTCGAVPAAELGLGSARAVSLPCSLLWPFPLGTEPLQESGAA